MDDLLKAAAEGNLSREEITETASKLLKMGEEAESAWVQTGKSVVGYSIESLAKLNPRLSAETVMELYEMLLERFRKIISLGQKRASRDACAVERTYIFPIRNYPMDHIDAIVEKIRDAIVGDLRKEFTEFKAEVRGQLEGMQRQLDGFRIAIETMNKRMD